MRRLASLLSVLLTAVCSFAQLSVVNTGGFVRINDNTIQGVDAVVLMNGIDFSSQLLYTGSESVEWVYKIGGVEYRSTQKDISPEDAVLYTLNIVGKPTMYIYVIDYAAYPIVWQSLEVLPEQADECQTLQLQATAVVPPLNYTDSKGVVRQLARSFTLSWTDVAWQTELWADSLVAMPITTLTAPITVNAPKCNATFVLSGDNWAEQLGIVPDSITAYYHAVRVECKMMGAVVEREYLNEKDRVSQTGEIEGSGPLQVEINSNVNPLDVVYYEWMVYSVETPDNYQRYSDVNFNYTFDKTGEYQVVLTATSSVCEYSDSVFVKVIESFIDVPNVFTPNGDGINDEWRVAYKSIEQYSCIVQNRWGRTVFKSDNPGKGWDGTIGGRPAAVGTYYYVILAYGTDKDINGKKMKYKLSGDINLLR